MENCDLKFEENESFMDLNFFCLLFVVRLEKPRLLDFVKSGD